MPDLQSRTISPLFSFFPHRASIKSKCETIRIDEDFSDVNRARTCCNLPVTHFSHSSSSLQSHPGSRHQLSPRSSIPLTEGNFFLISAGEDPKSPTSLRTSLRDAFTQIGTTDAVAEPAPDAAMAVLIDRVKGEQYMRWIPAGMRFGNSASCLSPAGLTSASCKGLYTPGLLSHKDVEIFRSSADAVFHFDSTCRTAYTTHPSIGFTLNISS